jgi:hypothetical protein
MHRFLTSSKVLTQSVRIANISAVVTTETCRNMDRLCENFRTYVMLTNKTHCLNYCFNSNFLVFYMFRTSYVLHQEDYIVYAAVYGMLVMHLCKLLSGLEDLFGRHA